MHDPFLGAELGAEVPEADLHGMSRFQAESEVERLVQSAFMRGEPVVRIIHGQGTGTLREAVRHMLSAHPNVKSSKVTAGVSYAEIESR